MDNHAMHCHCTREERHRTAEKIRICEIIKEWVSESRKVLQLTNTSKARKQ